MKKIILLLTIILFSIQSFASHGVGSDICVEQIGPNDFKLTIQLFRDCGGIDYDVGDLNGQVELRDQANNALITAFNGWVEVFRDSVDWCNPCANPTLCVQEIRFENTVTIQNNTNGYYIVWDDCCRNTAISNVNNPGTVGQLLYVDIPDPALPNGNNTPCFAPYPCDGFLCEDGREQCFNISVSDADGDSLVFSLVNPYDDATTIKPFVPITYIAGFNPLPAGNDFKIDSATGEICYKNTSMGIYVIGIKVEEYRNGVKIGETFRDLQFQTTDCGAAPPPNDSIIVSFLQDSTCFDFGTIVGDLSLDTTIMRVESCLFDVGGSLSLGPPLTPPGLCDCFNYNLNINGNNVSMTTKNQVFDSTNRSSFAVGNNGLRFCLVSPPCEIFDCPSQDLTVFFETRQECGARYLDTVVIPIKFTFDSVIPLTASNHTVTFDEPFCIDYLYRINGLKDTVDMKIEGSAVQYGNLQLPPDNGNNDRTFNYIDRSGTSQTGNASVFQTGLNTFRPFSSNSGFRFCGPITNCDIFQTNQIEFDIIYSVCDRFADTVHQIINIDNTFAPTYVPNVFTPNGDNDNDVFKITGKYQRCFDEFSIKIYDRWGKLVFDAENEEFEWDGKTKSGAESGEGTYYVLLEGTYGLEKVTDQYYITLLR